MHDLRTTHNDYDRFVESGSLSMNVRDLVAQSWRRSVEAGVDGDAVSAQLAFESDELTDYRAEHPLSDVFPLLYDVLGRAAEETDSLMAVGDAQGRLLWVCGRPNVLARAEQINFVEGTIWDEAHAGTNAPGTALRLDQAVQIRAAEHFCRPNQPWTCVAAPIHDPVTQEVLGIIDITGTDDVASAPVLAMVRAAARMAEAELGRLIAVSGARRTTAPARTTRRTVEALGRPDCQLDLDGRTIRLSPRHSEILVLLVDHPEGMSGEKLAVELYSDDVRASTIRAELTRLRNLLGDDVLESRPYRLRSVPECDWLTVAELLEQGRHAEALRAYRGPLLPNSDAPGVVERRELLERQLRTAVFGSGELDLMIAWTRSRWGADDIGMWQQQVDLLPISSPLRPLAQAETRRLYRELGLDPTIDRSITQRRLREFSI